MDFVIFVVVLVGIAAAIDQFKFDGVYRKKLFSMFGGGEKL